MNSVGILALLAALLFGLVPIRTRTETSTVDCPECCGGTECDLLPGAPGTLYATVTIGSDVINFVLTTIGDQWFETNRACGPETYDFYLLCLPGDDPDTMLFRFPGVIVCPGPEGNCPIHIDSISPVHLSASGVDFLGVCGTPGDTVPWSIVITE